MNPNRTVAWAVLLGANTAKRLGHEWGISLKAAWEHLDRTCQAGFIERHNRTYFVKVLL